MNRFKFLVVDFAITVSALGIYSCAKEGVSQEEQANLNVELRSRCGDNFNVAPTPSYTVALVNGLCCYSFTFTGIANNLSYTINGFDSNGAFLAGPLTSTGSPTFLCSGSLEGTVIKKCCLPQSVKTITITLSNGSCVSVSLSGCK